MGKNSTIEWTDHTFNQWIGCTPVGPGCDHCYAAAWSRRTGGPAWGQGQPRRRTSDANWKQPLKWEREARRFGYRSRVFCASLADVFDNEVPDDWRADLWALIRATPNLDWLIVTKRIGNAARMLPEDWGDGWPNVWLISTVVNQEEADRDIPKLLRTPAKVRGLSMEPLIGAVDISRWLRPRQMPNADGYGGDHHPGWTTDFTTLDWVIVGGESGPSARPMQDGWAESLRDQCVQERVPFFFKQWGEYLGENQIGYGILDYIPRDRNMIPIVLDGDEYYRVGKAHAGRLLDGRAWNEFPEVQPCA